MEAQIGPLSTATCFPILFSPFLFLHEQDGPLAATCPPPPPRSSKNLKWFFLKGKVRKLCTKNEGNRWGLEEENLAVPSSLSRLRPAAKPRKGTCAFNLRTYKFGKEEEAAAAVSLPCRNLDEGENGECLVVRRSYKRG